MVRRRALLTLALAVTLLGARPTDVRGVTLPPLALEDQEGRTLSLDALRGRVAVIVYGTRQAVQESIVWGRRLQTEVREGAGAGGPMEIVAVAQMGGVPEPFQGLVRAYLRRRTPAGFSLWLDWQDRLGALFGRHDDLPTVVVADRAGTVRLVVAGHAHGAEWDAVTDLVRRLR
jgi:hypothetical protein